MSRVRMHNISISLDGFAAGEPQALETPMGHAGQRLHRWMFDTAFGAAMVGRGGGSHGIDQAYAQRFADGIGVEIMGAGKFGPPGWQDDADWRGWWGEEPPFHTPVVVLTHRPREPLVVGDTTFHFLDATPAVALEAARELAGGLDVRVGGGADVARQFLAARLVDTAHLVQVPIVLGRGARLWNGLDGIEDDYDVETVTSPTGVVHLTLQRR
ncbi:dihydrofolate reductase family protein [Aeromicrobium sp. CnD17-E]|uniref:dihydrofolate reductase family protein n=1 Tax=Aeromicrobium sp. CnD17-E TaxID=2954487 RepID=UPI002097605B|nr:dihydrofolate reductase family protein [Aeromicrobium sp. CnD17-E]MCO7237914.1 dihydrofolate reductase family protein [Aeromicrobium sp. CnD17-E]